MSTGNDDDANPSIDDEPTIARPKPRLVPSINDEPTIVGGRSPMMVDEPPMRSGFANRWRRMTPILAVLIGVLAMGPFISRFIDAYRGVVMDFEDGKMLLQRPMRPPRWISAIDVPPGTVVAKEPFSWNPHAVDPIPKDAPQLELAERWRSSYEGVIVEMRPPNAPGRGSTAVVQTADGSRFEVSLFADHLATATVGRTLHKDASTWDPVMLALGNRPSGSFSLTPKEAPKGDPAKADAPKSDGRPLEPPKPASNH